MITNHLEVYHSFSSPNSRRVRMFLAEKGLTVPLAPSPRASNTPMPTARSIRDASWGETRREGAEAYLDVIARSEATKQFTLPLLCADPLARNDGSTFESPLAL
jgi:hypothetical protein